MHRFRYYFTQCHGNALYFKACMFVGVFISYNMKVMEVIKFKLNMKLASSYGVPVLPRICHATLA